MCCRGYTVIYDLMRKDEFNEDKVFKRDFLIYIYGVIESSKW